MPLIARAAAAGDDGSMRRTVAQALTVAVVVGVIATATLELAATPLLSALGAPPSSPLFEPADAYLRTRALAAPAVLLVAVGALASLFLSRKLMGLGEHKRTAHSPDNVIRCALLTTRSRFAEANCRATIRW